MKRKTQYCLIGISLIILVTAYYYLGKKSYEGCMDNSECKSFTYAPLDGDKDNSGKSVCTIYNTNDYSGRTWPGTDGTLQQIMCDRPADVSGCTDATANNYNAAATTDDGSCIADVSGCMTPTACNYNSAATTDNGSCIALLDNATCVNGISEYRI